MEVFLHRPAVVETFAGQTSGQVEESQISGPTGKGKKRARILFGATH